MTIKALIKKHPVLTYYALVFAISWGGVFILGSPYGMPATSEQSDKVWPIVFFPYFLGPSIAGLLLTGIVYGKEGYRQLLMRMLKWRVDTRWYAIALLAAPLLILPILLSLSLFSPIFLPDIFITTAKVSLIIQGIIVGLFFGGIMEELGWTGFAIPGLRQNYSVLTTGLIVGLLWGVWHLFPFYWASGDSSGVFSPLLFFPTALFAMGVLPAYRVLMVWVFDRTESQFVIMFMHMSITASSLFILAPAAMGIALINYYIILTTVIWLVVAVVAVINQGRFSIRARETGVAA